MIGNLIAAGSSLLGGIFGQRSQEKMAKQNIQLQKDFAQQGIQWKVADAKAAGIHPLYALGAQTHSFAPVSVGDSLGPAIANAGQDIGRAVNAVSSGSERTAGVTKALTALAVERASLENEVLRSQIRRNNAAGTPPPAPLPGTKWLIPGQGDTTIPDIPGTIVDKGLTRSGVDPAAGYRESGALADLGYAYTPGGGYFPVPSKDVKERIEDNMPAEWAWALRNMVGPAVGVNSSPPPIPKEEGKMWVFHPLYGYMQVKRPRNFRELHNWIRGDR